MSFFKQQDAVWTQQIRRFLTAQTISLFGSSLVQYAIVWYVTLSTSSGRMLTISTLCGFLPQILISLFAGVWIDRYDRKKMIMYADAAIATATLILAVSFFLGQDNIWLLFAVLVVRSAGTGIQTPAVGALIPQIVPQASLMRINGINSTLSSLMMFLSPAVSGAILSVASLELTLLIDVVTAAIGLSLTATIRVAALPGKARGENPYLKDIRAGFRYLKENRFVRRLLLFQLCLLFLISPSAFLTPLMVSRSFGPEVWRLTASEMTYSLGMVLGGLLIATWGGFKTRTRTTLLAGLFYGVLMIGLGAAPLFLLYLACNTLIGITAPCYNAPITVSIQERVAPDFHGRIFSFMQVSTSCALPLGMTLFGPLADQMPVPNILFLCGALVALLSLGMLISRALER